MSFEFYKTLHLAGIFLLIASLGGIGLHVINGGTRNFANRKWIAALHGVATTVVIIAGFGLMARTNLMATWPTWIFGKLMAWAILAAAPAALYRATSRAAIVAKIYFLLIPTVAAIAAILAIFKLGTV
jgi:uncharacterized membrane protein SirB2